jgi:uncharacterized protein YbjT (DUF2867 family)
MCLLLCFVMAEDLDKLREMEMFGENGRDGILTVMANVMDPQSLHEAFDGCVGVFHTSSLVDPGGISGYTVSGSTCIDVHTTVSTYIPEEKKKL